MKSVGQQLQEAREAKNWTPELAARETKIKVDRVRDLEADDYSHFSSPTYARGFVRTYARALGLDEYKILRQLDNKLPEDDNASFGSDSGMPYVPEPSVQATHVSSAPRTGLYIVLALGCAVMAVIAFVLLQAYRAGELPRYFASTSDNSISSGATNLAPMVDTEAPPHALPVDANDTSHSVRALPVDLSALAASPGTNAAPVTAAPSTNSTIATAPAAPVAQPVTASSSAPAIAPASSPVAAPATASTNTVVVASITPPTATTSMPAPSAQPVEAPPASVPPEPAPVTTSSARAANQSPEIVNAPRALPVDPAELAADEAKSAAAARAIPANSAPEPAEAPSAAPVALPVAPVATNADGTSPIVTPVDLGTSATPAAAPAADAPANSTAGKRLVLTASRDSFVEVTSLDSPASKPVLYASVLRAGQSLSFDGRKFSVNVGIPSAVDIVLDGVYYGPHSDGASPETFTLESHQP